MTRTGVARAIIVYVILLGAVATGCGVRFGDRAQQSELLSSLVQVGPPQSNSVRFELTYREFYPVPIALTCSLLRSDGREVIPSVRLTIPPSDSAVAPSAASNAAIAVVFTDIPSGKYTARCATDKAADAISTEVSV